MTKGERLTYAAVTPARNERDNLARLAEAMLHQRAQPEQWVIVDDASTDGTYELAAELAAAHEWITVLTSNRGAGVGGALKAGRRGGRDVVAFHTGIAALATTPDVVVKLDGDVSFEPDFFQRILEAFELDPKLGITGGSCWEQERGEWKERPVTRGHVRGATRAYRMACFKDVHPLEERLGWDGVDEAKAHIAGWTTRTLRTVPFLHHRPMGKRDGKIRAWFDQGETAHFLGYGVGYLVLRSLFKAVRDPSALAMIPGFVVARLARQPKCDDARVWRYMRSEQSLRKLPTRAREVLGRSQA
jgi:poly-beta-1,6-N-acetyl-D-glucosamine synthase